MIKIYLGMGCFWGYEKLFNEQFPYIKTEVGYATSKEFLSPVEVVLLEIPNGPIEQFIEVFLSYHYAEVDESFPVPDKYQSAVFCDNEELLNEVETVISKWQKSKGVKIKSKIVGSFAYKKAEDKHQKRYLSDLVICSPRKYT